MQPAPGTPHRPAVIADVAALAGVSVPTVSRVLTGSAKVSGDKTERVLAAVDELDYRPNGSARALASRRSRVVALLAGDTSRYGYAETIRGVELSARAAGYLVSIAVVDTVEPDEVRAAVDFALQQSVAGVVVLKFDPEGVAALGALPGSLPTVALSGEISGGVSQAVIDEATGAAAVVRHLLDLGHETVHHVRVPPSGKEDGRTGGWRSALVEAGARVPDVLDASWDPRSGRDVGRKLAADPTVTAVFCGNDEIALGVVRGLSDEGLRVPADVSVVGFDDVPLAELVQPALTTVRQDFAEMGARGFAQLLQVLEGDVTPRTSSRVAELVVRESTAEPPGNGRV